MAPPGRLFQGRPSPATHGGGSANSISDVPRRRIFIFFVTRPREAPAAAPRSVGRRQGRVANTQGRAGEMFPRSPNMREGGPGDVPRAASGAPRRGRAGRCSPRVPNTQGRAGRCSPRVPNTQGRAGRCSPRVPNTQERAGRCSPRVPGARGGGRGDVPRGSRRLRRGRGRGDVPLGSRTRRGGRGDVPPASRTLTGGREMFPTGPEHAGESGEMFPKGSRRHAGEGQGDVPCGSPNMHPGRAGQCSWKSPPARRHAPRQSWHRTAYLPR